MPCRIEEFDRPCSNHSHSRPVGQRPAACVFRKRCTLVAASGYYHWVMGHFSWLYWIGGVFILMFTQRWWLVKSAWGPFPACIPAFMTTNGIARSVVYAVFSIADMLIFKVNARYAQDTLAIDYGEKAHLGLAVTDHFKDHCQRPARTVSLTSRSLTSKNISPRTGWS